MQLNQFGTNRRIFEMKIGGLANILAQFFSRIGFREDSVSQSSGGESSLLRFTHFEDKFHGN